MLIFLVFCITISGIYSYDSTFITCDRESYVSFGVEIEPFYSQKWNETLPAPVYAQSQKCCWRVYIPIDFYVLFIMEANIGVDSTLKITDINNKTEIVMTSDQQPYVFVGSWFTIDLTVGPTIDATSFGFKVEWNPYPKPNPAYYNVTKASDALTFDEMLFENSVTITAETQVSLLAFPSDIPDLTPLLRLTLVFDGPTINSSYIGTLFQALRCNKPMISSSNQMTIFTFQEDYIIGSYFLVQDYYNVRKLSEMKGITCWSQSSCPVTLTAANGPVAVMTLNSDDGDEFIKRLDLSSDAVLKIYIGSRREGNDSNLIASYDLQQSKTNIPQKFNGDVMTYYLEKGTALVELAEDSNFTRWNDAASGREGFITSRQLGTLCDTQDVYETIGGLSNTVSETDQMFEFTVNVTYVDVSNDAKLTITFGNDTEHKQYTISKESSPSSSVYTAISNNLTVLYFTNQTSSTGFYLEFKIDSAQSPGSYASTFMPFFVILLFLL
ncbi:hypothetical protein L3Y34_004630 [Caenorhabditis briggsae]|uniref:CUB-like domain-containing protein n=1 Tax=Caenorhabditis briggsae TaxID=6238 RepID=A0AAE9ACE4_CAEBR|nr:hypothetical protein L3Y34_004630 [Caenorhabditis briggsae]